MPLSTIYAIIFPASAGVFLLHVLCHVRVGDIPRIRGGVSVIYRSMMYA